MKRLIILLAVVASGCGGDPANIEGTYTISVTNRENGCNLPNWTVGESASGIQVVIFQENDNATADVMGATRVALDLWLGAHTFSGKVDGDEFDLVLESTRAYTTGNCTYTYDAHIQGRIQGDALSGRINYISVGNGHSDCAAITGCVTYQDFNGTRPPS